MSNVIPLAPPGSTVWHENDEYMIVSTPGQRDTVVYKRPVGGTELTDGGFHLSREQYESLVKAYHGLEQALDDLLQSGGDWEEAWDTINEHTATPLHDLMPEHHRT